MLSFPIGKHDFSQSGKRVQQTMQKQMNPSVTFHFLWNSVPFSLDIHAILIGISEHRKSKLLHYETQCYKVWKSGSGDQANSQSKRVPELNSRKIPVHFHWILNDSRSRIPEIGNVTWS